MQNLPNNTIPTRCPICGELLEDMPVTIEHDKAVYGLGCYECGVTYKA